MKNELRKIYLKGGILSPGEMKQIIRMVRSLGLETLKFGSRQDILFTHDESHTSTFSQYPNLNIGTNEVGSSQNIVCSYVSSDIFPATPWLKGSTYLYILEQFRYNPCLKINITDPKQQMVPLFSGQLNFIASEHEDYWFLNLNLPNWERSIEYPALIYSWDIPKVAEAIEELYEETTDVDLLFQMVNEKFETNNRTIDHDLKIPFHPFPYYEGMNKMGDQ